jgi:hypothetical protein
VFKGYGREIHPPQKPFQQDSRGVNRPEQLFSRQENDHQAEKRQHTLDEKYQKEQKFLEFGSKFP